MKSTEVKYGIYEAVNGRKGEIMNIWQPQIIEDSSSGKRSVDLLTRSLSNRKVFLNGAITEETGDAFLLQMLYLAESNKPVDLYINSPGGLVTAGMKIYDILQSLEGKLCINSYCTGMAASMAAVILAGGQKGRRFILPHSEVMIHEPLIEGGVGGSATSIQKKAESIIETRNITNGILARHTGKSLEEINKATSFDNFMNAEEAIAFGICDEIRNIF